MLPIDTLDFGRWVALVLQMRPFCWCLYDPFIDPRFSKPCPCFQSLEISVNLGAQVFILKLPRVDNEKPISFWCTLCHLKRCSAIARVDSRDSIDLQGTFCTEVCQRIFNMVLESSLPKSIWCLAADATRTNHWWSEGLPTDSDGAEEIGEKSDFFRGGRKGPKWAGLWWP